MRGKSVEGSERVLIGVTIDDSLQFVQGLPEVLRARGWEVHIVSGSGPRIDKYADAHLADTHVIQMAREPRIYRDLIAFFQWTLLLRRLRPTILLVGTPKASLLSMTAGAILRVPVRAYVLHGLRLETATGPLRSVLKLMEWLTCRAATHIIAVSSSLEALAVAEGLVPPGKSVVLGRGSSNGVDPRAYSTFADSELESLRDSVGLDPSKPVVGYVGRLAKDKGLDALAEALRRLKVDGTDVQALIVGDADDDAGADCVRALRESGQKVLAIGYQSDPSPWFRLMDVFCFPTLREGLGNVVLEAFANGIPVVSTNATGVRDLVIDGVTGFVAPVGDAAALATCIRYALNNTDHTALVTRNARLLVTRSYRREDVLRRTVAFLEAVRIADNVPPREWVVRAPWRRQVARNDLQEDCYKRS